MGYGVTDEWYTGFLVSVELAKMVSLNYEFTKFKLEASAC